MNVLMIHPHDIYSNLEPWTVRITNLARELVKSGHQVKLVYHLMDTSLSLEEARCRQEFPFETIPQIRFQRTLIKKFWEFNKLAKWADIIHFQKCFAHAALPAIWAAYRQRKPVHYDWDDWEYEIYNYRPVNEAMGRSIDRLEKRIPRLVDTVTVASRSLRDLCMECGVREDRIFEGHVGADLEMFSPDIDGSHVKRMHDLESPIVLYLGQLHGAQYAELFIHAAKQILSRRDNVDFMIVGSGDRFGELHLLAEQLGLGGKIVFTGAVNHEMVPQYIAAADVAVACFEDNKQTRTKSPLKIVEYLASGKAIVASDVGEARNMINGCGILAAPGDAGSLAQGIETLLKDPQLRTELGQKARRRAIEKYNWAVTASNLIQAYGLGLDMAGKRLWTRKNNPKELKGRLRGFWERNRLLIGIMDGEKVYQGPFLVQLDVTNRCNNDCIACWCRSPLLAEKVMDAETQKQTLPIDLIERILEELQEMGTREIYLAGGGEPTMHPQFMKVLAAIKKHQMAVHINTNFTLIDKRKAKRIVNLGVDHLTVSLWAGTAQTYSKCHPNKTEETFHQICDVLRYLVDVKADRPFIKLYNVISKINYFEIEEMADLAFDLGVESVEFTMADIIPGYTDTLLLSENERRQLLELCHHVQEKIERRNKGRDKKLILFRFDEFIRRISTEDSLDGNYDKNVIDSIPCYVGWFFARILPDGGVNSCLKSHRIPVGNVYEKRFREIWVSEKQAEFRRKTLVYEKDDPYFSLIGNDPTARVGCYKSCDNIGHNQHVHEMVKSLGVAKKMLIKAGKFFCKPYA